MPSSLLLHSFLVISVLGCATFIPFTPAPSFSSGRSSMFSSLARWDAPRSGSPCHIYGDLRASSAVLLVPAAGNLPSDPLIAVSYPAKRPRRLFLSTAPCVTAGLPAAHTRARPEAYLAMTRTSDVWDSCSAVVWDESRRSNTRSHVELTCQTAAEELTHPAFRAGSSLDHCTSPPSAFREMAIPRRIDTYPLRRDRFIEALRLSRYRRRRTHPSKTSFVRSEPG